MDPAVEFTLWLIAGLFVLWAVIAFGWNQLARKMKTRWQKRLERMNEHFKWELKPPTFERNYGFTTRKTDVALRGTYGGRSIAVRQMIRGVASAQGPSQILAYRFGVGLSNECGLTLSLGRKGSLRRLQAFFGRPEKGDHEEIVVGKIAATCSDAEFLEQALLPEMRQRLLALFDSNIRVSGIQLKDKSLSYLELHGIFQKRVMERDRSLPDLLVDLGDAVETYAEVRQAQPARNEGDDPVAE